ncbi:MAG: DNA repair protein RecN [Geobacteraceae bacterium]|nr:DNA repair protein RecN [Geobacteraceae bacterium]
MLTDISIKNFAIIDSLHVAFGSGLNILTGETGAGKSIIIDAVNLVMGGRGSADLIRSGAEEASVEAIFDISGLGGFAETLGDMGIDVEGELLLKRVITRSGRNRVFINGSLSTISALGEIASRLVNIYGQHESQTLLKVENHLLLLDGYASLSPVRGEFTALHREYRSVRERLASFDKTASDAARERDLLSWQLDEISSASLTIGEDLAIEGELNILVNAEKLLLKAEGGYELLYGADESALGILGIVRNSLVDAAAIDPALQPLVEVVASSVIQLEDAAMQLRGYLSKVENDPARLATLQERMELINKLKKKYGSSIDKVLAKGAEFAEALAVIDNADHCREELATELKRLENELHSKGEQLGKARQVASLTLKEGLEKELHQLAMKHAVFQIRIDRLEEPRESGFDRVEILFSPNPGEEAKPLAKIASGGELSRIMLAMKQLHPESDVPTLVFDEVDTGIGGATSAMVGKKLKAVAARQQVLCITHLPQVAVYADSHYQVAKRVEEGRTHTSLALLSPEERVDEVARMLGGLTVTDKSREHAAEMIGAAAV